MLDNAECLAIGAFTGFFIQNTVKKVERFSAIRIAQVERKKELSTAKVDKAVKGDIAQKNTATFLGAVDVFE